MSQAIPAVAADETFDGTWPLRAHYTDAPGFRMHYVEEGSGPETGKSHSGVKRVTCIKDLPSPRRHKT